MNPARLSLLAVLIALPVLSIGACGTGVGKDDKAICQASIQNDAAYVERATDFGQPDSKRSEAFAEYAETLKTRAEAAGDDLADALTALRRQMLRLAADPDAYDAEAVQAAYHQVYAACEAAGAPWQAGSGPAVSASPSRSYAADTKMWCDAAMTDLSAAGGDIGAELSRFIAHRQANEPALAEKARIDVGERLKVVVTVLREAVEPALDPEFKAAGEEAAENVIRAVEDGAFFEKFTTEEEANRVLEREMTVWFAPLDPFCG